MKIIIKIFKVSIIFIFISFISLESLIIIEANKEYKEEVDYLFILGAKLYVDKPSPALLERLKVGVDYLKIYPNVKVVLSGGMGGDEKISEAQAMKNYLREKGISESRIILEDKSTNTFENIKLGLGKIREDDDREDIKIIIATSDFHLLRSKLIAKRLGLKAYGLPAKVPPSIILQSYIREYFALVKTFFLDK